MNTSKSGKSAYFHHVFANNFFGTFFKTFSTDLKSAWNSVFLHPIGFLEKHFILALISIFSKVSKEMRPRQVNKTENLFFLHVF